MGVATAYNGIRIESKLWSHCLLIQYADKLPNCSRFRETTILHLNLCSCLGIKSSRLFSSFSFCRLTGLSLALVHKHDKMSLGSHSSTQTCPDFWGTFYRPQTKFVKNSVYGEGVRGVHNPPR